MRAIQVARALSGIGFHFNWMAHTRWAMTIVDLSAGNEFRP